MSAIADPAEVAAIGARLEVVRDRLTRAGGADVRIVGVTKGQPSSVLAAAAAVGLTEVGESYAQELAPKAATIAANGLRCHFIGQLQTNKVRALAGIVDVYQSVDRASLVTELARRAPGASVMIQVDLTTEAGASASGRGGCTFDDAPDLVESAAAAGLVVEGLMGVAPAPDPRDRGAARRAFDRLAALRIELGLAELSVGMSGDLEDAVAAGSTMVRIGTAVFGPRSV